MLFTTLAVATATASKWLIAGKVMVTVGTGLLTAAPAIERMKKGGKIQRTRSKYSVA